MLSRHTLALHLHHLRQRLSNVL